MDTNDATAEICLVGEGEDGNPIELVGNKKVCY